jgi:rubrerythrin
MDNRRDGAEVALIAELNDLLQLDHDALQAYSLAIATLADEALRETLIDYREDHERHVRDLTALIEAHGGTPVALPHLPTGLFKLAVQASGIAGGDRGILLAFEANEGQVRRKYERHAARPHAADVAEVLARNARDEEKHHIWAAEALRRMGAGPESMVGTASLAFAAVHRTTADVLEAGGRIGLEALEMARRFIG